MPNRRQLEDFASKFKTVGGIVQSQGTRRDFDKYAKEIYFNGEMDKSYPDFRQSIVDYLDNADTETIGDNGCTDPDGAIEEFIADKDLRVRPDGRQLSMGPFVDMMPPDLKEHFREWCYRKNQYLGKEDTKYSHCDLYSVFFSKLKDMEVGMWRDIQKNIAYDPAAGKKLPSTIAKVFEALYVSDKDRDRYNADRLMLAHWAWTLKRRICKLDKNPALPMMMVFRGKQGGGKTSFVEKYLGSVFSNRVVSTDLSTLHDKAEFEKWTSNVIINFDELSFKGIKSGDRGRTTDLLKQLLTSSHTQERMFHTQSQQTFDIRATFCCTSNNPLAERISDHTGMRRYWEIICDNNESRPQFDWDKLAAIDWLDFWRGVDEHQPRGYITPEHKFFSKIESVQNDYCVQPSLRRWFEEHYEVYHRKKLYELTGYGINKDEDLRKDGVTTFSALGLYGEYTDAMQEVDNYAVSQSHFIGCLEKMGVLRVPRSKTHVKSHVFVVRKI